MGDLIYSIALLVMCTHEIYMYDIDISTETEALKLQVVVDFKLLLNA